MTSVVFPGDAFDEKVSLNLNTTLEQSFNILSKILGMNIILDQSTPKTSNINLQIKDMSVKNIFTLILQLNNLDYKNIDENSLLIYPKSKEQSYVEEKTEIYYLNNIKAENMSNLIKSNISILKVYVDTPLNSISVTTTEKNIEIINALVKEYDNNSLYSEKTFYLSYTNTESAQEYFSKFLFISDYSVNKDLNSITLKGRIAELDKAEELIKKIDIKKAQVVIDIMLVDASESLNRSLGLTFNSLFKIIDAKTLFETLLRPENLIASKTESNAKILANPSIRVINKEKASINIGERVPIIVGHNTNTSSTSKDSYNVVPEVEYKNVGILLDVLPTIHLDDDISINLSLEVSSVGETIETNYGSYPSFNTKNITTVIRLKDGQTAVFGGLINNEERESRVSIPILGDIPVLGKLFSKTTKNPGKSEITMFITPRIVNNLAEDEVIKELNKEDAK